MQETHHRDGTQEIEVAAESFAASEDALQDAIAVVQTALLMTLDALVEYSRTHGGTIIEVLDPVARATASSTAPPAAPAPAS
jgi:acyl-CoA hydrolase